MALSKADPAQLASMSSTAAGAGTGENGSGDGGGGGPVLYLDTASNQIILRTENSDPALEMHPKFTLREENGQYILVQIPPTQESNPIHPPSNQEALQTSVENSNTDLQLQGQHAADYLATVMSTINNTVPTSSALEQSHGITYIQNTTSATPMNIEQSQALAAMQEIDVSQTSGQTGSVQQMDAADMSALQAHISQGVIDESLKSEDAGGEEKNVDTELVLTEETLQQLSSTSGGSLVLVQPDGSTYELQLQDNKYSIKPYNPTGEEINNIKHEQSPDGIPQDPETTEMSIMDPSQYIQTFDSSGIVNNEHLRSRIDQESIEAANSIASQSSGTDLRNIQLHNISVAQDTSGVLTTSAENSLINTGFVTPLTIVRTGTNLNVVYAQGGEGSHGQEGIRTGSIEGSTHEIQIQDSVVINPQDFVNQF